MSERLISLNMIIAAVEHATGRPRRQILSERRNPQLVQARWAVWWLATKLTVLSMPAIAEATNRNHSTVSAGIEAAERLRAADESYRAATDAVLATLLVAERNQNIRLAQAADPLATARRVLWAPEREAVRVSVAEIIAMAQLVVELAPPTDPTRSPAMENSDAA